mgnify:CR=1 FL=1|jgi:hypothetical protein
MSFLSNLLKDAAPVVARTLPGTPIGTVALAKTVADQKAQRKFLQRTAEAEQAEQQRRYQDMVMGSGEFGSPGLTFTAPKVQQAGFFSQLGDLASSVGSTLISGAQQVLPGIIGQKVFGVRPQSAAQGPALTTITNVGAQESQGSGSIQAGAGALLPSILGGARSLLKSPAGQLALGTGAGFATSMITGDAKGMRVTRKMKSQARMILNMTGGNLSATADILGIDQNTLVMILLKRFRNDGPVVTKAALRKTKQTVRRLKSMCDMYDSLRPTATRRRSPMKRASTTTLIKN